jgi:hypothetical protein
MTNSSNTPPSSTLFRWPFLNQLNEAEVLEWLTRNSKKMLYALAALIACIFLLYQASSRSANRLEADYIKAANEFALFSRGEKEEESLQELLGLMNKNPELHAAYDGAVAQALLNQNHWLEAEPLALSTLKRTASDTLSAYRQFAEISLLVAAQKWSDALEQAQKFQQTLALQLNEPVKKAEDFGKTELFALNLLRIGMLQQQLGDSKGELDTWQLWKEYAGLEAGTASQIDSAAFRAINQQFAQGVVSLPDYFAYRKQQMIEK